jgi:hypothetical protein
MATASEQAGSATVVALEGGPLDGRRLASDLDVEWVSLLTPSGPATYAPAGRTNRDGLPVFAWRPLRPR